MNLFGFGGSLIDVNATRTAATARSGSGFFRFDRKIGNRSDHAVTAKRWRKHVHIDRCRFDRIIINVATVRVVATIAAVIGVAIVPVTIIVVAFIVVPVRSWAAIVALAIVLTARWATILVTLFGVNALGRALFVPIVARPFITLGAAFLETGAGFSDNAEIMIRELKIIFRHHTVAGKLGIAGQALVLFKKLRRIATCAIVDAVALFAATILWALSTPAATTASLTIVEQEMSLFSGVKPVFRVSSQQDPDRDVPQHIFCLPKPDHPSHSLR